MEKLEWYELGYYEDEDFEEEEQEAKFFVGRPCPLDITESDVERHLHEDLSYVYTSVFKNTYNQLEEMTYQRLLQKFSNLNEVQLDALRKRALSYIIEALLRRQEFYAYNDWTLIRKEILLNSQVKELVSGTIDEVLSGDVFLSLPEYAKEKLGESELRDDLEDTKRELQANVLQLNEEEDNAMVQGYASRLRENISAIDNGISNVLSYLEEDVEGYESQKNLEVQDRKEELAKNLKKRFGRMFIINHFYPNITSLNSDLVNDIYLAVSETENWKKATPAFKEEFDQILTKTLNNQSRK